MIKSCILCFKLHTVLGRSSFFSLKSPSSCSLFVKVKVNITEKLYHDEQICREIIFCISSVVQNKVLDRIRGFKFFGIIIDESLDISVTYHLLVFVSFVKDGLHLGIFLGLLSTKNGNKDAHIIYETHIRSMRE